MKKRIVVYIIIVLIIVCSLISFILWNNKTIATITLDINPSIEINLLKNEKIKSIIALNDDAKNIISDNFKGKSLKETLDLITNNLLKKGYASENERLEIILYSTGNISNNNLKNKLNKSLEKNHIDYNIIVIDKVDKEDKEFAKKYNISPAKASYIKTITYDNKNISFEQLVNKSVNELKETKETGYYCPKEYILEGSWCLKEINQTSAAKGEICPPNYYEYNGICYEEKESIESDNYICMSEFTLKNDKCVRELTENAIPTKYTCTSGTAKTRLEAGLTNENNGDAKDIVCVDASNATHPMSPCEVNDGTEYTMSGGKCYWHRAPVIAEGCPGKIQVGGECWDDASNILICVGARDGKRYSSRDEFCEGSIKYSNPEVSEYKCENKNAKLDGNKCIINEIENAQKERYCPNGYTLVDNDRCINYSKTANKEKGLVCDGENTKLKGNICITYEKIEANHN